MTLKEAWAAAILAGHDIELAKATAKAKESVFNQLMAEECKRLCVPPGYSIDFLGDETVKPTEKCLKAPPQ